MCGSTDDDDERARVSHAVASGTWVRRATAKAAFEEGVSMERTAPSDRGDLHLTRRTLLARVGTGVAAFTVATAVGRLTPAEARAQRAPLGLLSDEEARTLGALGDVLLP